jgi:bile acid-coenzyme A ligase
MARMPIGRLMDWLAVQHPDRPAITFEGQTLTRLELEQRTNRLARAYQHYGVGQDDLVTIALPNGIEFYEAALAVWKLGATPQPVSARLPRLEREAIVELANPALVVGAESGSLGARPVLAAGFTPAPSLSDAPLPERTARYWKAPTSGGSTGRPKLIVAEAPGVFDPEQELFPHLPNRTHLVAGPLYHNAAFANSMLALFLGNHLVVLPRFDALRTLECLALYRIDLVVLVPTMMQRIWRLGKAVHTQYDLSALRLMVHMSAPCPPWLKEAWITWLGPERVHELYGGTEGLSYTWITGTEWLTHRGSVGKPMPGGQMQIRNAQGHVLPPEALGEIYMRPDAGPGTTYHYIGAEPKRVDGWESLGDLGWMDEEGYLYLADRQTDMILRGGANIYPAEVEAALDAHPRVRSSAVIGLPDEDLGQRVHAIVDAPGGVTDAELLAHLADRLVRYKIPQSFEYVTEPLRDDDGKVRRSALRDQRIAASESAADSAGSTSEPST